MVVGSSAFGGVGGERGDVRKALENSRALADSVELEGKAPA